MGQIDKFIRTLVPSVPTISRNGPVMAVLDLLDRGISFPFPEFRDLPPNRFRIRIGVGNRIFFNQAAFLQYSYGSWMMLMKYFGTLSDNIVDIGSGCGRTAYALKNNPYFTGHYTGIDVDREMVTWCQKNFPTDQFRFVHADIYSSVYNPSGSKEPYRLPLEDESVDLVFSQSLFTHLLEDDLKAYVAESYRVLRKGKLMAMSVFCIEDMHEASLVGDRWTFAHRIENALVENPKFPEAAVAYSRDFLVKVGREAGFAECEVRVSVPQGGLICRK